jgi:transcriptional regulator with XRE-family HTH domain
MSPARFTAPTATAVRAALDRVWANFGQAVRDARTGRRWTSADLARRAGAWRSLTYLIERGDAASFEACARVATALGLRLELDLLDPRARRPVVGRAVDPVHSAMVEFEAAHPRALGHRVAIDEPYQHYQYAGRADLLAWDLDARALLHIENRTRFPDLQAAAGSWNAKRAYLAPVIADRLRIRPWASVTHVMVGLWSAEVLHTLRLRTETSRALCPDPPDAFLAWWNGSRPGTGNSASFVVLDPFASGKQRMFIGLDDALTARPRVRGYVHAAERLQNAERR